MTGLWLMSYLVLWGLVLGQTFLLLALARQIGLLHTRLGPTGARMINAGPEIGDLAPPLEVTDMLNGKQVTMGAEQGKHTLLMFISPACSNCADLVSPIKTLMRTEQNLKIVLISNEDNLEANHKFIQEHRLTHIPFVASADLSTRYQIGITPYAILIDQDAKIQAKGLVNNQAHLESLLNVEEVGYVSVQDLYREHELQHAAKPLD